MKALDPYLKQQEFTIYILDLHSTSLLVSQLSSEISPKLDLSIEGMRSQQFSEGVFAFLLLGIVIFSGIVIAVMFNINRPGDLKFGERILFGAIILGIVVSIILGAMQMLGGYLF
ncbi:MAG: hypothetical protein WC216_02120 [Gallionella sp.]